MDTQRSVRALSRRRFLYGLGGLSVVSIVAACGQSAAPAKPAGETKPAESKPAAPAAQGQPTQAAAKPAETKPAAAAPTTAAAAKPKDAESLATVPGVFNVWFNANWNTVTDEKIGQSFVNWGQQNGIKVEWQSIPGSPQVLAKQSASVAAGQPPELTNQNLVYWYSQGELADLKDLTNKVKDQAGGMYPIGISSMTGNDGGVFGIPYGIDVWPPQWRIDAIGKLTGGKPFESWDQLIELGPKAQQPPRNYTVAFALGHEGDTVNNFLSVAWSYGGRLNDEKGVPDIINPANKAAIETNARMWEAKIIPPDSFAQTVTSWNNETYQKGRGLMAINPATIMGWLLVNDKELAENTGISQMPKGPAGSFTEGASLGFNYFKKSKMADRAPAALEYFVAPENMNEISKAVEGRFVPVYRDHTKNDFWQTSKFAEMRVVAENGRVRNWPAPQQSWLADVTEARFTISDMLHKVINEKMPIEEAQAWAQNDMMDSYNKIEKRG
jgi:ABC-type glycerol-3-phosphate transport system substrate-binding protein